MSDDATPIAARRADALSGVTETYLNNSESSGSTANRHQVIVHVSGDQVPRGETASIENGPGVSAVTSHRIACDCSLVRINEDKNCEPLNIGRRSRSIPARMPRALHVRDKVCREMAGWRTHGLAISRVGAVLSVPKWERWLE